MLTCLTWVRKGVSKEEPDKVELSKEELEEIVGQTKEKLSTLENQELRDLKDASIENAKKFAKELEEDEELYKEFNLDDYDEEDGTLMTGGGMEGLAYHASNEDDPYITMKNQIDEQERDDFCIKPTDNLVVVGKVDDDYSGLDIHLYNEEEGSFYVHHDILLDSFPIAVEWMNFDPNLNDGETGSYVAVGTMEQHIEVWDLDIVDAIEPSFLLGKKKKKKKKVNAKNTGHSDAVLGLSWNQNVRNVLASGSADETVVLWDMSQLIGVHKLKHHNDKVQCVKWHPFEAQSLLTGSFDKTVKAMDCRNPEACMKTWKLSGEVEQVVWNHFSPFQFVAATDEGQVYCCDVRVDKPLFVIDAHQGDVSGLSLSTKVQGCLTTIGSDKTMKVWDIMDNKPRFIASREMKMGRLHCVCSCPDLPYTFAFGGEKDGLRVLDLLEMADANNHFSARSSLSAKDVSLPTNDQEQNNTLDEPMETCEAESAMASLSLSKKTEAKTSKGGAKRKTKKTKR